MPPLETINVQVDAEAARIYREASEQDRRKMNLLMGLDIRMMTRSDRTLEQIMDDLSDQAQRNGLTPEILRDILDE